MNITYRLLALLGLVAALTACPQTPAPNPVIPPAPVTPTPPPPTNPTPPAPVTPTPPAPPTPPVPDTTRPIVNAYRTSQNAAFATATIQYYFSEAMDQNSVQSAFSSTPPLTCAWTWGVNEATCAVTTGLQQNTTYTLILGASAQDLAGNALAATDQGAFTTSNFTPRVTAFTPNPGSIFESFSSNSAITVTFSEPMNVAGLPVNAFKAMVGSTVIAGNLVWSGSPAGADTVLTFTPTIGYGLGVSVTWTLRQDISDTTGIGLGVVVSNSFRTRAR